MAPLQGIKYYILVFSLGVAVFLDSLDFSIANVSIPSISATFGVAVNQGTWVITLFAVGNALGLALSGWLASRFGAVKVNSWSLALFTALSAFCGAAWSFEILILARLLQGLVSGPLMVIPISLALTNCPEDKKLNTQQVLILLIVMAQVLGPFLGGWITEEYGWRWIFYINVPLGILALIFSWSVLKDRELPIIKIPLDFIAVAFLAIGILALQLFLDRGNENDWFDSTYILLLALTSAVSLTFFIVWNFYSDHPPVDFSFLKDLNFTMATLLLTLPYLIISGTTILLPLWVQSEMGYTPYWAGVSLMPLGLAPIFAAPFVNFAMKHISLRMIIAFGLVICSISCFWFSKLNGEVSLYQLLMPRLLQGISLSLIFLPLFQLVMTNIKEIDLTKATGVHNFLKVVCGGPGISTALYVTFWQRRATLHHSNLTEVLHPLRTPTLETYNTLHSLGVDDSSIAVYLNYVVTNQSYTIAFNDLMWLSGWILLFLIPPLWICQEPSKNKSLVHQME